jgi:cytoskeletal protein CcmA (bactofilin family)
MWNKRVEEDPGTRPVASPTASPVKTKAPESAGHNSEPSRPTALFGETMIVEGEIHSSEDLTIDGQVTGSIDVPEHRLTIGPRGTVDVATVKAREVVIIGSLKGSIDASDKVLIRKDARLEGDVQTAGIVIEDGAYFKGGIDIRRPKLD